MVGKEEYFKTWNLSFYNPDENYSLYLNKLSVLGKQKLKKELEDAYPTLQSNLGSFVGNIFTGNKLFNYLVNKFYDERRLQSRCLRISIINLDFEKIKSLMGVKYDLVLLDGVEPSLYKIEERRLLYEVVERLVVRSNLVLLNIPDEHENDYLPKSVEQILFQSGLNFNITGK